MIRQMMSVIQMPPIYRAAATRKASKAGRFQSSKLAPSSISYFHFYYGSEFTTLGHKSLLRY